MEFDLWTLIPGVLAAVTSLLAIFVSVQHLTSGVRLRHSEVTLREALAMVSSGAQRAQVRTQYERVVARIVARQFIPDWMLMLPFAMFASGNVAIPLYNGLTFDQESADPIYWLTLVSGVLMGNFGIAGLTELYRSRRVIEHRFKNHRDMPQITVGSLFQTVTNIQDARQAVSALVLSLGMTIVVFSTTLAYAYAYAYAGPPWLQRASIVGYLLLYLGVGVSNRWRQSERSENRRAAHHESGTAEMVRAAANESTRSITNRSQAAPNENETQPFKTTEVGLDPQENGKEPT